MINLTRVLKLLVLQYAILLFVWYTLKTVYGIEIDLKSPRGQMAVLFVFCIVLYHFYAMFTDGSTIESIGA